MTKSFVTFALCAVIGASNALAADYHVATTGDDVTGDGSPGNPWRTIQHALDQMAAGDTLFIRGGTYHEKVVVDNLDGTATDPVTIAAYPGETVTLDGTRPVAEIGGGTWTQHAGNIYKTTLTADTWQLFVDGAMMIPARWPNAFLHDDSIWGQDARWAKGLNGPSENGTMVDAANNGNDLAASGLDATGAMAILNVGNWKTGSRIVSAHTAGSDTFTYDPVSFLYKDKNLYYYLEAKLELLDAEREWCYDASMGDLYLWSPVGGPPGAGVRAKVQSYALDFTRSDYVILDGLDFFATTFRFDRCRNVVVQDCNLDFPSASKRMLGSTAGPDVTEIRQSSNNTLSDCSLINCSIENTDSHAIYMLGIGNRIENCVFRNIDFSVSELPGLMVSIYMNGSGSVFRRNTVSRTGASSTLSLGKGPEVTLNEVWDTGNLQSDGSITQFTIPAQPGSRVHHNWFHDTVKSGARFDATVPPEALGSDGTMDHNVAWNCDRGLMLKGERHFAYNNTVFNSDGKDIVISDENVPEAPDPGNDQSITRNNVADWLTGRRAGSTHVPVPGTADHNWNGYTTGTEAEAQLVDPAMRDFRPRAGADLIDAGIAVTGITDGHAGAAPDIGAYEAGDANYWIPGRQAVKASHPIPADGATEQPGDRDLIWLGGYQGTSYNVFFGDDEAAVDAATPASPEFRGNQTNNIFVPSGVRGNTTYYWRIDTVTPSGTVTGDVWEYTYTTLPVLPVIGFCWERSVDHDDGAALLSTDGNPNTDANGSPAWQYEYADGGDFLGGASPWYRQTPASGSALMTWEDMFTSGDHRWARNDGVDGNQPSVTPGALYYRNNFAPAQFTPLVRWINPLAEPAYLDLTGSLTVVWTQNAIENTDVVIAHFDVSAGTWTELFSTTVTYDPDEVEVALPVTMGVTQQRLVEPGDAIVISHKTQPHANSGGSAVVLRDDLTICIVPLDTDLDRLPDDWELSWFENLDVTGGLPGQDFDGDGSDDTDECSAGTDPMDSGDFLRIVALSGLGSVLNVDWPSVSGKVYRLYSSTDLMSWMLYSTHIGTGGTMNVPMDTTALGDPETLFITVAASDG